MGQLHLLHQQMASVATTNRRRHKWRHKKAKKASSYIAQYPALRTVQSALQHFTSLTDLFTQTPSRLLWEASSNMLQLMHSFIQLSELEQCRVKKLAQGFNIAAQDSNPGFRSRESETLPLSHCALHITYMYIAFMNYVYH